MLSFSTKTRPAVWRNRCGTRSVKIAVVISLCWLRTLYDKIGHQVELRTQQINQNTLEVPSNIHLFCKITNNDLLPVASFSGS